MPNGQNGRSRPRPYACGLTKRCTATTCVPSRDGWITTSGLRGRRSFSNQIDSGRSLIFFYANYSNPYSEEESRRYVLIGASRVKTVGDRLEYANADDRVRERFAGGMIWARNVSTHYPDEGLRLPYHAYREDSEAMQRIGVFPENPRTCKFGSRIVTDDEAIGLLEQLLSAVQELKAMGTIAKTGMHVNAGCWDALRICGTRGDCILDCSTSCGFWARSGPH